MIMWNKNTKKFLAFVLIILPKENKVKLFMILCAFNSVQRVGGFTNLPFALRTKRNFYAHTLIFAHHKYFPRADISEHHADNS